MNSASRPTSTRRTGSPTASCSSRRPPAPTLPTRRSTTPSGSCAAAQARSRSDQLTHRAPAIATGWVTATACERRRLPRAVDAVHVQGVLIALRRAGVWPGARSAVSSKAKPVHEREQAPGQQLGRLGRGDGFRSGPRASPSAVGEDRAVRTTRSQSSWHTPPPVDYPMSLPPVFAWHQAHAVSAGGPAVRAW